MLSNLTVVDEKYNKLLPLSIINILTLILNQINGNNHEEIVSSNNNFNIYRNLYPTFFIKLFLNSIVFF